MKLESRLLHQCECAYSASWIKCSEISSLRMNELEPLSQIHSGDRVTLGYPHSYCSCEFGPSQNPYKSEGAERTDAVSWKIHSSGSCSSLSSCLFIPRKQMVSHSPSYDGSTTGKNKSRGLDSGFLPWLSWVWYHEPWWECRKWKWGTTQRSTREFV